MTSYEITYGIIYSNILVLLNLLKFSFYLYLYI